VPQSVGKSKVFAPSTACSENVHRVGNRCI